MALIRFKALGDKGQPYNSAATTATRPEASREGPERENATASIGKCCDEREPVQIEPFGSARG